MAKTFSYIDIHNATTDTVDVPKAPKGASVTHLGTMMTPGGSKAVYNATSSDESHPSTITYQSLLDNKPQVSLRKVSVQLNTYIHRTDTVTGVVDVQPIVGRIELQLPTGPGWDQGTGPAMEVASQLFSALFPSVAAGVPATTVLKNLLMGASAVL